MLKKNKQPIRLIISLWGKITIHRKKQFILLLSLMIFGSISEVVSIGAIFPFLGVLTNPEYIYKLTFMKPLVSFLEISNPIKLLLPVTIIFGTAALLAGMIRVLLLYTSIRLSFAVGADLSTEIYRRSLYQPYHVHINRNSSEIIDAISTKTSHIISWIIIPTLNLITASILLIAFIGTFGYLQPILAFYVCIGFSIIYFFIGLLSRKKLLEGSKLAAFQSIQVMKSIQEGLGGIREVLIENAQEMYCSIYENADLALRKSEGKNAFISQSPRYAIEAVALVLFAILAYIVALSEGGIQAALPILGALALGAQRLLPVLQQAYNSWALIQGGQASLEGALELLNQKMPMQSGKIIRSALPFKDKISLKGISYSYDNGKHFIIDDVSLEIPRGSYIGFKGLTGSGKSTLLDIIMGLTYPEIGSLEVDGVSINHANSDLWHENISHVPQSIFLMDATVAENIAFGVIKENIDIVRVREVAQMANISNTIEKWERGYETLIGERGIRLSGGQRQRLGIARALYKNSDIIILDEATSALDDETERLVIESIQGLKERLTIIMVAHRLGSLKNCSEIYEVKNGKLYKENNLK